MPRHEFMLRWRTGPMETTETARDYLDEVIGEVVGQYEAFELIASDVQVLPRRAGGNAPRESTDEVPSTSYPADAPPHPWDQGLFIFPDDHPFAPFERMARDNEYVHPEKRDEEKQAFLEAGQKMLPRGST